MLRECRRDDQSLGRYRKITEKLSDTLTHWSVETTSSVRDASLTEALIPKDKNPSCRRERSQQHIELASENLQKLPVKACNDPAGLAGT